MKSAKPAPWIFGPFELNPTENVLRKNGQPVRLGHQPLRALTLLVSRAGELVTREELREHIWSDRVNVDFEHGLNVCIRQIRAALGEDADAGGIILTVPRIGYRVKVPVGRGRSNDRFMKPLRIAAAATAAAAGLAICTYSAVHWSTGHPLPRNNALHFPAVFEPGHSAPGIPARLGFVRPTPPRNPEAAALLWRGRATYDSDSGGSGSGGTASIALRYFKRAVDTDPSFAQAHAGVAIAATELATLGVDSRRSSQSATESASLALQLDASLPESHIAAAEVMYRLRGDWSGADEEYRRALIIAPDDAFGHLRYAYFLRQQRRFDDAIDHLRTAYKLDPMLPSADREIARTHYFQRRYDDCIQHARRSLDLDPNALGTYQTLGQCLEAKGLTEQAISAYQHGGKVALGSLGRLFAHSGRQREAQWLAKMLINENPREVGVSIAMIYDGLGDREETISWLERTYAGGRQLPFALRVANHWDEMRSDDRFLALLKTEAVAGH